MKVRNLGLTICIIVSVALTSITLFGAESNFELKNVSAASEKGTTLYVGGSGPNNYTRIQDAIDNASDGNAVFVYNGTYYENILIQNPSVGKKTINLLGEDKNTTIIDGGGIGRVVYISAEYSNITGFTIQNSGSDSDWDGGIVIGATPISVVGNIIKNNIDGIYTWENNINISQNIIENNTRKGIYLSGSLSCYIIGNTIEANGECGIDATGDNNIIYHNNFIDNQEDNAVGGQGDTWDNGYPSGGNYWSDYDGIDIYQGPYQNITGSDGIGDKPYNVTGNGKDNYPLMNPWGGTLPPTIDYLSITFGCYPNEIPDQSLSTNFTLECYAATFNDTSGFIGFVDANWNLLNTDSNATISSPSGTSVELFSGWLDGTATLTADDGSGHSDSVVFTIDQSVFSMFIGCGWNLIGWWQDYDTDAPTLGQYIHSCKTVCRFKVETQMYQTHVVGIPYNEFTITRGMGLFIYTPTASIWDGTDGTP